MTDSIPDAFQPVTGATIGFIGLIALIAAGIIVYAWWKDRSTLLARAADRQEHTESATEHGVEAAMGRRRKLRNQN